MGCLGKERNDAPGDATYGLIRKLGAVNLRGATLAEWGRITWFNDSYCPFQFWYSTGLSPCLVWIYRPLTPYTYFFLKWLPAKETDYTLHQTWKELTLAEHHSLHRGWGSILLRKDHKHLIKSCKNTHNVSNSTPEVWNWFLFWSL